MSRVYTLIIDRKGRVASCAEARNANAFHRAIWDHLLVKYELARPHRHFPDQAEGGSDLVVLGKLWSRIGKIDRDDGLVLAATFDRVWFPREEALLRQLHDALRKVQGELPRSYFPSLAHVANCINHVDWKDGDRGIAFSGSVASPWSCEADDNHRLDKHGHACKVCGKKIQHAVHMLDEIECCRELDDAIYAEDA